MMTATERMGSMIEVVPWSGCWLWTGYLTQKGYGQLTVDGRNHRAHRLSYELRHGPIAGDFDHLCRVRCCVNPDHLEPVTSRTNTLRGVGLAAVNARKEFCERGHELDARNTHFYNGYRVCRKCTVMRTQRYRKRHG